MAEKNITQVEFAKIMGISKQAVSKLVAKGVLSKRAKVATWFVQYGKHMAQVAAGWQSREGFDLIGERARLAARQSEKLEIELAQSRDELIPIEAIAKALSFVNAAIKSSLLVIPSRLKSQCPVISVEQIKVLENLIRETLINLSHERFPPAVREIARTYFSYLHGAAKVNGAHEHPQPARKFQNAYGEKI